MLLSKPCAKTMDNSSSAFTLWDVSSNWHGRTGESRAGERCGKKSLHVEGRTSAINKEIAVTHGFFWAKGVFRKPFPKAIYSIAESFLLTVGMWHSIWQFLGHLWFEIKHRYNNLLCSVQAVDSLFFLILLCLPCCSKFYAKPSSQPGYTSYRRVQAFPGCHRLWQCTQEVVTLLNVCPSYVGQHHRKIAQ